MLRKLMKHELRSTSRILLPLFLIILVLSVGTSVVVRNGESVTNPILTAVNIIIVSAYGIALCAVFLVLLVLMINRFRTNLLSDEGYIMFTLPASVHQLVWSKIIVCCLWFLATVVVVGLSGLIVGFDLDMLREVREFIADVLQFLNARYAINGTIILIEALVLFFVGFASFCLQFYSAMSFGQSFAKHKRLLAVAFFFGSQFVVQFILSLFFSNRNLELYFENFFSQYSPMTSIHIFFGLSILISLIYAAIFYLVTTYCLQKRLNIE